MELVSVIRHARELGNLSKFLDIFTMLALSSVGERQNFS